MFSCEEPCQYGRSCNKCTDTFYWIRIKTLLPFWLNINVDICTFATAIFNYKCTTLCENVVQLMKELLHIRIRSESRCKTSTFLSVFQNSNNRKAISARRQIIVLRSQKKQHTLFQTQLSIISYK